MTVTLKQGDGTSTQAPVKRAARWWVESVTDRQALSAIVPAWDDLAWQAAEPNPFYESWMLLPAWERFAASGPSAVLLVYRDGPRPSDPPELCGLLPVVRESWAWGLTSGLVSWRHEYCFLATPLIRQGVAIETVRVLWDWLASHEFGAAVWDLPHLTAAGPVHQAVIEVANERQAVRMTAHQYNRALLLPIESSEAYCARTMTCHNRQELRRQRRRLSDRGGVSVRSSQPGDDLGWWIEQFLRLESQGWKGREATALAANEADASYFRAIARAAADRRQLVFLGLFVDDQPVALKINFLSGSGSFAFKIAFDEAWAKFSPGVQLELENIDWVHQQAGVAWMDSCAKAGHFMIGRLWSERRTIERLVLSTGRWDGDLVVGSWPLVRALRRRCRPSHAASGSATAAPLATQVIPPNPADATAVASQSH